MDNLPALSSCATSISVRLRGSSEFRRTASNVLMVTPPSHLPYLASPCGILRGVRQGCTSGCPHHLPAFGEVSSRRCGLRSFRRGDYCPRPAATKRRGSRRARQPGRARRASRTRLGSDEPDFQPRSRRVQRSRWSGRLARRLTLNVCQPPVPGASDFGIL